MFRKVKRHYHLTKEAYLDAFKGSELFNFTIGQKAGENLTYSENSPQQDKTSRFAMLVFRFLDEESDLYYVKVWELIRSEYPNVVTEDEIQFVEQRILKIESGSMGFNYNERDFTAKEMFELIAASGYFYRNSEAAKIYEGISQMPIALNLLWFQFKSFAFSAFEIASHLLDLILRIEQTDEYRAKNQLAQVQTAKCIYCLSETNSFKSEEHVIPESLAGDEVYLPRGMVCDDCNNGILSGLDDDLINFEPIAFLRVNFTPYTKGGKFPKANFHNVIIEKTEPNVIKITPKDKSGGIRNQQVNEDGSVAFNIKWNGKKGTWINVGRAIYKIALGFVAFDAGHDTALNSKYDDARKFITEGKTSDKNMIVSFKSKPDPSIRTSLEINDYEGSAFLLNIFGFIFMINLEVSPIVKLSEELVELGRTCDVTFALISLSDGSVSQ